jgi:ADP-heptose:LPS heptosyltransferase
MNRAHEEGALARFRDRYRRQDFVFSILNRLLGLFIRSERNPVPRHPRRILVANAGHLGDVVMSTAIFPVLKDAFPDTTIDFLTGSYSQAAVEGHPLLDRVLVLDHWRSSRTKQSLWRKVARFYACIPSVTRTVRAARYDLALDLHAWHPNYVLLFWLARIPVRAGYGRVGYGPTLTHPVAFHYDRRHELQRQLDVLRELGISETSIGLASPSLKPIPVKARQKAQALLGGMSPGTRYRVLHPVSSTPTRDWMANAWIELAGRLVRSGITPVITGLGERDMATAKTICESEPKAISIVNRASWTELMAVLEGAEVVYSVETSIGHLARALGRPVVAIYGGMDDPLSWSPVGSEVATRALPCVPCFNPQGCPTRDCLTRLTVDEVEATAERAVQSGRPALLSPAMN